jgi:cytochrome c oxidase accessory protein FixG
LNKPSQFELPKDRLASTDETGKRTYIYPAYLKGPLKRWRTCVYYVLLVIFLGLPWVTINNYQAVLLNIPQRQFSFFGLAFWAHETPLLLGIVTILILTLGIVTALYGRVWCGWACPQTVFIDSVFRRIENLIEGYGISQKKFNNQPFSLGKVSKKVLKWLLFLLFSLLITHSFLAYFIGSKKVLEIIHRAPQENWLSFLMILLSTSLVLFNFAWFREQFCIIACPYGRLQSVLMDENSKVVLYDTKRGEPRKKMPADESSGDCINCYRCVQVCPTGIDIRRGTQMECIMCTACMDACNQVMTTLNRPKKLIRYDSETTHSSKKSSKFRVFVYIALLSIVVGLFTYSIRSRDMVPLHVKRMANPPYTLNGDIVFNQFNVTVHNQYFEPIDIEFNYNGEGLLAIRLIRPTVVLSASGGSSVVYSFFTEFPRSVLTDGKRVIPLTVTITKESDTIAMKKEVTLIGPRTTY